MKNIFFVSFSAQIVIMPIMAYTYKTVSLTFFITNILTSSLIGIIIIMGFLLILASFINIEIAKFIGIAYKALIDLLLFITENTAKIPFSVVYVKVPYIWQILLYYIIIFTLFFMYKKLGKKQLIEVIKKNSKKIIAIVLIITIISTLIEITPKNLRIYFIDVGQGDSCLIITPENTKILIDGGGSETYDVGENTLLPYLLNRRIKTVDYVICSHFDTDHVGGIKTILENLNVKNIIVSNQKEEYENFKAIMEIATRKKVNIIVVKASDRIVFDKNTYMDVLYPSEKLPHSDINNNSIVAKFICGNIRILFTRRYRKGGRRKSA